MICKPCGDKPKKGRHFTSAVIEINNPESLVLLRKVVLPSSLGDDTTVPPAVGKYRNVILQYEANDHLYLYSSDGIPTFIKTAVPQEVLDRITTLETDVTALESGLETETGARERADGVLQQEIDDLKNSPDVVDIVATYADLMAYDTSSLGDKDVVRVLADETHEGQSDYYRWSTTTETWTFIGTVGPYYTKEQTDALLDGKQDELTPGENISIVDESGELVISAQDTTYTAGYGLELNGTEFSVDSSVIQDTLVAGDNITIEDESGSLVISATDTTYNNFVGTDGTTAGQAGLVPAPTTTDAGKVLGANGNWVTGGPNVVQTTGTSTADVMSQNATTSMVFADPETQYKIKIGAGTSTSEGTNAVEIGRSATANAAGAIAIGYSAQSFGSSGAALGRSSYAYASNSTALGAYASATGAYSAAIGYASTATAQGEVGIGLLSAYDTFGYNGSAYRLLTGLYDGQSAHDAATYGQVLSYSAINGAGAPTTATEGKYVGQLYYDTTNEAMYFLKTIDTTTTPETYTWEALGGGGGGDTVYSTKTTSNSATGGAVYIGNLGTDQIPVQDPSPNDNHYKYFWALPSSNNGATYGQPGNGTVNILGSARGANSVSIGLGAGAGAYGAAYAVAVGTDANAGPGGVSVGNGSGTNQDFSGDVCIGQGATITASGVKNSISLGYYARATRTGELNIGIVGQSGQGFNSTDYRVIGGVHDGQDAHDAVTKGQLDSAVADIGLELDGKQDELTAGTGISIAEESGALVISATGTEVSTINSQDWSALWQ